MWSKYFSHIYVLALPERRPYMERVVADLGIPHPIFVPLPGGPDIMPGMSRGEALTWASHVTAMRDFLARKGDRRMLVFEDDIEATTDQIDLKPMELVPDHAVVYLGRCWSHCWLDTPVVEGLVRARRSSCMHAVSLSPYAAQSYVDLTPYAPADDMLQDLILSGRVDSYAFQPGLFRQNQTRFASTSGARRPDPVTFDCKRDPIWILYLIVIVLMSAIAYTLFSISTLPGT